MGSDWWQWERSEIKYKKYFNIFYKIFTVLFKIKQIRIFVIEHRFECVKAFQKIVNENIPGWDVKIKLYNDN